MKLSESPLARCCPCSDCHQYPASPLAAQHAAINQLAATLDERTRRVVVGLLAQRQGRGGIARLAQITQMELHHLAAQGTTEPMTKLFPGAA